MKFTHSLLISGLTRSFNSVLSSSNHEYLWNVPLSISSFSQIKNLRLALLFNSLRISFGSQNQFSTSASFIAGQSNDFQFISTTQ